MARGGTACPVHLACRSLHIPDDSRLGCLLPIYSGNEKHTGGSGMRIELKTADGKSVGGLDVPDEIIKSAHQLSKFM
jgi:hypothetical protein